MMKQITSNIFTCLISLPGLVYADSYIQQAPGIAMDIYSHKQAEPTCCYSERRLWKDTNTQSGWSVNPSQFNPMGFAQRDKYQAIRPTPLPRDRVQGNPWSVPMTANTVSYQRINQNQSPWSNAQYFQPAGYHYPPPVNNHYELDYVPDAFTGYGDPFLHGMAYPGYAPLGYDAPWMSPGYPGVGIFPAYGPFGW